jgi:hypothetical protein
MSREELDLATGPDDAVSTKRPKISLPDPSFYQTTFAKTKLPKKSLPDPSFYQTTFATSSKNYF